MNAVPAPDDRVSAYLDGELDAAERQSVDGHLAASAEWRAELDEVAYARDTLRSLPTHEAPPGFWERVLAPELTEARDRRQRRSRVRRMTALASAGVAVAAVVIASLVIPSPDRVTPQVPALSDSHAVRTSVSDEPATKLATMSMVTPFRR
jgi:anti-sigma factor RsiW